MPISLAARKVSHRFGNIVALDDVSIDVAAGRVTALVGESGSGKTTLLRCFNRLVEPEHGQVLVGDQDVRTQSPVSLRRGIGYVQQHGGLLPHWRAVLQESFDKLRHDLTVTTLLVAHDLAEAGRLAEEVVVMRKGRIEQRGSMRDLIRAPATDYVARLIERARAGLEALRA